MTNSELLTLIERAGRLGGEGRTLALRGAAEGCPDGLYGTLSAFSNQDDGGVILFGLVPGAGFSGAGVYDGDDLIARVTEQCGQMQPRVVPVFTVAERRGDWFVAAEVPGLARGERPCFYQGKGQVGGAFVRVGGDDVPMTEYEIHAYAAAQRGGAGDVRPVARAALTALDKSATDLFLLRLKGEKPGLAQMQDPQILDLVGMTGGGKPTVAGLLLFCPFPQAFLPNVCIDAAAFAGRTADAPVSDRRRLEGPLVAMLNGGLTFVREHARNYPMVAVRKALLNALIHRDYGAHAEGISIQLSVFDDRLELRNPCGHCARVRTDEAGRERRDTPNPTLARAMEVLGESENRFSGIGVLRRELAAANMPAPDLTEARGMFTVRIWRETDEAPLADSDARLLQFCQTPRSRAEIAAFLGVKTLQYAVLRHVMPLVERGLLTRTLPDLPKSKNQRYQST